MPEKLFFPKHFFWREKKEATTEHDWIEGPNTNPFFEKRKTRVLGEADVRANELSNNKICAQKRETHQTQRKQDPSCECRHRSKSCRVFPAPPPSVTFSTVCLISF
jgi:hypothetical protein